MKTTSIKSSKSLTIESNFATVRDYVTTITILESLNDAIFIVEPKGRIEYANQSAVDLLRTNTLALSQRSIDEIIICENSFSSLQYNLESNPQESIVSRFIPGINSDVEALLVNGELQIPVILNFNIIQDVKDEIGYYIVTAKDISSRQYVEKELKEQQAISVSRERLRALGELSVGLVHELSQPLAAMSLKIGYMRSIAQKAAKVEPDQDKNLQEMAELVNRMAVTINNTRSFANQTETKSASIVNVNDCVDCAWNLVNYEMKKRDIKITITKGQGLPVIFANPLLVEQVIVNLLTNAKDAFDQKSGSEGCSGETPREISINTSDIQGKWVKIEVEDNAGGIDPETLLKIFNPFFTTKKPEVNSGVGLTISKRIVNSFGGDISVAVKPGNGSIFTVRIPVTEKEEGEQLFNLIEMLNN